jgi:DNA-binding transcriptional LysR family regulator
VRCHRARGWFLACASVQEFPPTTHPFAARDSVVYADLRAESFIINPVVDSPPVRWLAEQQRHGLPGRVAAEAASIQEILALVASGRGVCLVPESVA